MRKLFLNVGYLSFFTLLASSLVLTSCGNPADGDDSLRSDQRPARGAQRRRNARNVTANPCPATYSADDLAMAKLTLPIVGGLPEMTKATLTNDQKTQIESMVTACTAFFQKYDAKMVCQDSLGRIHRTEKLKNSCDRAAAFLK